MKKFFTIAVTNDVVTDQRVGKLVRALLEQGAEVRVIGRHLPWSLSLNDYPCRVTRYRMLFRKGFLFYAFFNLRLFFTLMFSRRSVLVANDLDTLLPVFLAGRLRRLPVVYDSHEYFTGVPEILDRHFVRWVWERIERMTVPHVPVRITVNRSIADLYHEKYGVHFEVVRNLAPRYREESMPGREALGLPSGKPVLILQGAGINRDRGGEEMVEAMALLPEMFLLVVGSGDVVPFLRERSRQLGLSGRVLFTGRMPYREMMQYTRLADLGLSLDKDTSINQRFSLPNKLFDYIQAGIPVLASPLPEVKRVVEQYDIGELLHAHEPVVLARQNREILGDSMKLKRWKAGLAKAAEELCWEKEEQLLLEIYRRAGLPG